MHLTNRLCIAFIFILVYKVASATENFGRKYSDTLPEKFIVEISKLRDHIYYGIDSSYKQSERNDRMVFRFADYQAYAIAEEISSGDVYSDWDELENYVNEVLKKITPVELINDSVIHAYIQRDGQFNAFMTGSGHTFINIGLFAYVNDEATLAAILAHELAHYYLKHSLKNFLREEKGIINIFRGKDIFSIKQEEEADSLAVVWFQKSGYNILGLVNAFRIMKRDYDLAVRQMEDKWELKATTHPLPEDRLSKIYEHYKKSGVSNGESFLVSKEKFERLKEECKPEILKSLLLDFDYDDCIEVAFKFHLHDPENITYIYYLLEAIRRRCYLFHDIWNENFYTHRYFDHKTDDNGRKKVKYENHLFKKFDTEIMSMDNSDLKNIKARFYWDNIPKFTTNSEAYEFFYRVSQALQCNECVFSKAMRHNDVIPVRDSLLRHYLTLSDIEHSEFARNLLDNNVIGKLSNKKLTVLTTFDVNIKQGDDEVPLRIQTDEDSKFLSSLIDSATRYFPNRISLTLPSIKKNDLNSYRLLKELWYFSDITTISKGKERPELHFLDPRFLKVYYKFDVNEIEFFHFRYNDFRSAEKSKSQYADVMNTTFKQAFEQAKRTRYLEMYLSSVREMSKNLMKVKYYHEQYQIPFNIPATGDLIKNMIITMKEKDKKAYALDYEYK